MPHDRRTRRTSLILIGVVCSAVPIGCLRSSNLRPSPSPLPDLTPAGELQADGRSNNLSTPGRETGIAVRTDEQATSLLSVQPPPPTVSTGLKPSRRDPTALQTGSPPLVTPTAAGAEAVIEPTALPTSPMPLPSGDTPRPATPPASTPLLDADIRRVEDVIRQHSESLRLGDATEPLPGAFMVLPTPSIPDWEGSKPSGPMTEPAKNPVLVAPPQQHPEEPSPLPISLLHGQDESSIITTRVSVPIPSNDQVTNPARTAAPERSSNARPEPPRDPESESKQDVAIERAEDPVQPNPVDVAGPTQDQRPPMRITELKLCRKVERFGSFEPLDSTAIKPGRPILVYCEMAGLEYEARGDQFVSRLSSHLELRSDGEGPIVWEQALQTAEDVCRRPRHDYFVWYRINLPIPLEPGSYRLRMVETDLIAERTTSAEIPMTITP